MGVTPDEQHVRGKMPRMFSSVNAIWGPAAICAHGLYIGWSHVFFLFAYQLPAERRREHERSRPHAPREYQSCT